MQWTLDTVRYSLSSLKLSIYGVTIIGSQVAKAEEEIGGDFVYGQSNLAMGRVLGPVKGTVSLGFIPEELDTLVDAIGNGFAATPIPFAASFFDPASTSGVYTLSNPSLWLTKQSLDVAREAPGAIITVDFATGTDLMSWNGYTALDLSLIDVTPSSVGALFGALGLSLS